MLLRKTWFSLVGFLPEYVVDEKKHILLNGNKLNLAINPRIKHPKISGYFDWLIRMFLDKQGWWSRNVPNGLSRQNSPSSSQSCRHLSVIPVPCCRHRDRRGSAMNCSVMSVSIRAPFESRILSISLTCTTHKNLGLSASCINYRTNTHLCLTKISIIFWRTKQVICT